MGRLIAPVDSQELQIACQQTKSIEAEGVNVVLTAFEPYIFGNVKENVPTKTACWESIRLIPGRGVNFTRPVNIYCYRLRNIYDFISKQVQRCWEKHNPDLVVIMGQHKNSDSNEIVLEKVAGSTHVLRDQLNSLPKTACCTNSPGLMSLETELDLPDIVDKLHKANIGFKGKVATTYNGYYLCDYAYYNSLHINPKRSVCIRVPEKQEIGAEDVADALSLCIANMLHQLDGTNK